MYVQPDQQGLLAAWDELIEHSHGQHHVGLGLQVCGGWQPVLIQAVVWAEQIKLFLATLCLSVFCLFNGCAMASTAASGSNGISYNSAPVAPQHITQLVAAYTLCCHAVLSAVLKR